MLPAVRDAGITTLAHMTHLELVNLIRAPLGECFDLSLSVDAHAKSMVRSGERPIAGVTSGLMHLGETVTWQGRHFGLPFRLTSTISSYERPSRFVDEQIRGPFASWHHEHLFEAVTETETEMIDKVDFRAPFGPVGAVVDRLLLERYMRRLLEVRNAYLVAELERHSDTRSERE